MPKESDIEAKLAKLAKLEQLLAEQGIAVADEEVESVIKDIDDADVADTAETNTAPTPIETTTDKAEPKSTRRTKRAAAKTTATPKKAERTTTKTAKKPAPKKAKTTKQPKSAKVNKSEPEIKSPYAAPVATSTTEAPVTIAAASTETKGRKSPGTDSATAGTRKAPTKFGSLKESTRRQKVQALVVGGLLVAGIGASAAVGVSADTGQIDVAATIRDRNERMSTMVEVEGPVTTVAAPPVVADGGFVAAAPEFQTTQSPPVAIPSNQDDNTAASTSATSSNDAIDNQVDESGAETDMITAAPIATSSASTTQDNLFMEPAATSSSTDLVETTNY
jgi:hypothetical protein